VNRTIVIGAPARVHFTGPAAERPDGEVALFLDRFNGPTSTDHVLLAGQAHQWFVTIHPFDDGDAPIARAIADIALPRSDQSPKRYYSMSARIQLERNDYYDELVNRDILAQDCAGGLSTNSSLIEPAGKIGPVP
jgi:Fic family protein